MYMQCIQDEETIESNMISMNNMIAKMNKMIAIKVTMGALLCLWTDQAHMKVHACSGLVPARGYWDHSGISRILQKCSVLFRNHSGCLFAVPVTSMSQA